MNETIFQILVKLSGLNYIDGTTISNQLGITLAVVWRAIEKLQREHYFTIEVDLRKGYRLMEPLIILDQKLISAEIKYKGVLIECFSIIDSTNTYVQNSRSTHAYHICIAEQQTRGKGRFDRTWSSPLAQNLYFSIKVNLHKGLSELSGLSLAVSVSITKTLSEIFPKLDIKIKWPNDIYVSNKKISGVLIEVKAESHVKSQIVIGVGINVNMRINHTILQEWSSLANELNSYIDRNSLASILINSLIQSLQCFELEGFNSFNVDYDCYDYLKGKLVSLSILNSREVISGIANGVNELGQLTLIVKGKKQVFSSGEVSIIKR